MIGKVSICSWVTIDLLKPGDVIACSRYSPRTVKALHEGYIIEFEENFLNDTLHKGERVKLIHRPDKESIPMKKKAPFERTEKRDSNLKISMEEYNNIDSESIKSMTYWYENMQLTVRFVAAKPTQYTYQSIAPKLWELLKTIADTQGTVSLGSAFNFLVKIHPEKYPYQKDVIVE